MEVEGAEEGEGERGGGDGNYLLRFLHGLLVADFS